MEIKNIFDKNALDKIVDVLNTKCNEGNRITRSELCHEIGFTEPLPEKASKDAKHHNLTIESVVSSIISLGVIEGFNAKKGRNGGIGRNGDVAPVGDKKAKKAQKRIEYPEGFVDSIRNALETLCVGNKRISRKDIINSFTLPDGIDMIEGVNLLSSAKRDGLLTGFESHPGVGGGFCRASAPREVMPAVIETATAETATAETATAETATAETATATAEVATAEATTAETAATETAEVAPKTKSSKKKSRK
jgi:hypothetical protein